MRTRSLISGCVLALIVSACTAADPAASSLSSSLRDGGDSVAIDTLTSTDGSPGTGAISDPLDSQIDWFVRAANGSAVDEAVYEEHFVDTFRRAVPFETFMAGLRSLVDIPGDWLVVNVERDGELAAVVLLAAGEEQARASIEVDPVDGGRIAGLLIQPAALPAAPADLEEAYQVAGRSGMARMLAAEVTGTTCEPVFERGADEPTPLGSVFKLYVLGSLAKAIEAGDISWDDELVIREELKSIPSGVLQDEADGTVVSVQEAALLMISISDNTATDHLIDLVGRERIEQDLSAFGMTDPSLSIPFLTTRELAALKVGPAAGLRTQYLEGDEAERRAILEQISDISVGDLPIEDLTEPIDPDRLEWFATPADMCRVLANLWDLGARPGMEPLRGILTENPGIAPQDREWAAVAFKGGSEPGLVATAWLVETDEGDLYSLTGAVVNPDAIVNELEVISAFAAARDLLGE